MFLTLTILTVAVAAPSWSEEARRSISPLNVKPEGSTHQSPNSPEWYAAPVGYEPRSTDKRSFRGKTLYKQHDCARCHSIEGRGGEIGPPLDGIGGHRGREWLIARLLDPKKQMEEFPEVFGGKPSLMPHQGFSSNTAKLLADYLLTLQEPKAGFLVLHHPRIDTEKGWSETASNRESWQPQAESDAVRSGKELFISLHCGACHSLDGSRGRFGPDLSGIGYRRSSTELEKILSGAVRSSVMKKQTERLGDEQIFDIKAFLLTLPRATEKTD